VPCAHSQTCCHQMSNTTAVRCSGGKLAALRGSWAARERDQRYGRCGAVPDVVGIWCDT
jgi:hypothetical protein